MAFPLGTSPRPTKAATRKRRRHGRWFSKTRTWPKTLTASGQTIRLHQNLQRSLSEESRWLTDPQERNRWQLSTWVETLSCQGAMTNYVGMPAWFLPWNRPPRPRRHR